MLAFSTLQLITTLVLFTYDLGGAVARIVPLAAGGSYLNWLLPGLLAQYSIFNGGQTTAGLTDDLVKGVSDRFRSLTFASSVFVRISSNFADGTIQFRPGCDAARRAWGRER